MARHILPGNPSISDKVFVDTNILVYAKDAAYPEKQKICKELSALQLNLWAVSNSGRAPSV